MKNMAVEEMQLQTVYTDDSWMCFASLLVVMVTVVYGLLEGQLPLKERSTLSYQSMVFDVFKDSVEMF